MQNPRLGTRYAKSLIDLSVERGELEQVYQDMLYLQALTKESREFLNLLRSPVIKSDVKTKILDSVTEGKVSELTKAFTTLMVSKSRESNLPEIASSFVDQYKSLKGIHTVTLTTATPISEAVKAELVAQVRSTSEMQDIELEAKVDESLIGGFVLQVGDKMVDASISYDLKEVAKQFENNDFVYKVR
ncbi:MAG TPA: ATP synthase F1 subunit delta [Flavisolibacter sp.]|nr:ATP synthase F1 subunit delta [Flavisolibacter sp.]